MFVGIAVIFPWAAEQLSLLGDSSAILKGGRRENPSLVIRPPFVLLFLSKEQHNCYQSYVIRLQYIESVMI